MVYIFAKENRLQTLFFVGNTLPVEIYTWLPREMNLVYRLKDERKTH